MICPLKFASVRFFLSVMSETPLTAESQRLIFLFMLGDGAQDLPEQASDSEARAMSSQL